MKNKLIYIFLGIFLLSSQSAFAADKGIREILSDLKNGKTIEGEKKYTAVLDGDFSFTKKIVDTNLALYAVLDSTIEKNRITFLNAIFVKVDDNQFLVPNQNLPKGKYKLIDFVDYNIQQLDGNQETINVLVFEKLNN